FKFLISNLYDFDPARDAVAPKDLEPFDRWILHQLNDLIRRAIGFYETYEFHRIYHIVHNFCAVSLSALYLDVIKDRLYCSAPNDPTRRCAQTVCHRLLDALTRLLAPILVFTSEEAWIHGRLGPETSVHLASMPQVDPELDAPELIETWDRLLELRAEVSRALEAARRDRLIGSSLDATVNLTPADE